MGTPDEIPHEFEELVILFLEKRITDEQISLLEEWLEKDDIYLHYFDEINTIYQFGIVQRLSPEKMKLVWEKLIKKMKR